MNRDQFYRYMRNELISFDEEIYQELIAAYSPDIIPDDDVISRDLFNYFDVDRSGGLSFDELNAFWLNLPPEYGVRWDQAVQFWREYDTDGNGVLDEREFYQMLNRMNQEARSIGITTFIPFCRAIVRENLSTEDQSVPMDVDDNDTSSPEVHDDQTIDPRSLIPGTQHTWADLAHNFFSPGPEGNIHRYCDNMTNPAAGMQIMIDANTAAGVDQAGNDPHIAQNHPHFVLSLRHFLLSSLSDENSEWLPKEDMKRLISDRPRLTAMVDAICRQLGEGGLLNFVPHRLRSHIPYTSFNILYIILNFLQRGNRRMMAEWADIWISDIMSAYNSLDEWRPRSSISCGAGQIERAWASIRNVIVMDSLEREGMGEVRAEPQLSAAQRDAVIRIRRAHYIPTRLNDFLQEFFERVGRGEEVWDDENNNLRRYVERGIRERGGNDNDPSYWGLDAWLQGDDVRAIKDLVNGGRKLSRKTRKVGKKKLKTKNNYKKQKKTKKTKKVRK
jgi:hypothetical protein